jgi:hypothetical protein
VRRDIDRHRPPPGRRIAPPDDRLRRAIKYSEALAIEPKGRGVLDTPLEPVIGLAEGETRWRSMTGLCGAMRRLTTDPVQTPSFRDGPKDQTRNLEIPGSILRIAPE